MTLLLAVAALAVVATSARPQSADPQAVEVALDALDAMARSWAIDDYDAAERVRIAINLRGGSASLTGNLVVDRRAPAWRLDTAGGVGPLTFAVSGATAVLHVPSLRQYATRRAGALATSSIGVSPSAAIADTRDRLRRGYDPLVHLGVVRVDGSPTDRIRDTPAPGATVDYWIDRETKLPRRVHLARGSDETRIDLRYGAGQRPTEIVVETIGTRSTRAVLTPAYDGRGRVKLLHAVVRPPSGPTLSADLRFDWAPRLAPGFLAFSPSADAERVPFQQLLAGVMFSAAGQLGSLLPLVTGGS